MRFIVTTTTRFLTVLLAAGAFATVPAAAQGRDRRDDGDRGPAKVPPGHYPAAGQCRVWHDDLPPGRQPAPTSCAQARRDAARDGGRVVYGSARDDRYRDDDRYDDRRGDDDRYDDGRDDDGRYDDGRRRDGDYRRRAPDERRAQDGWPSTMPYMDAAVQLQSRGRRTEDVRRWLGDAAERVAYQDGNRDGIPERVTWYDRGGAVVQRWFGPDRSGRAERIEIWERGRRVRTIDR